MAGSRPKYVRSSKANPTHNVRWGRRLFLSFLVTVASIYAVILGYHFAVPQHPAVVAGDINWLDQCRDLCLSYGLIPTGHVANDATAYLEAAKPGSLPTDFEAIWNDEEFVAAESQAHPLLGKPAPDFKLPNDRGELVSLRELNAQGPVLVVFYYGYGCSHCVAQLFGIQKDLQHFSHLGAQIVAISADPSEKTAAQFEKYGRFDFPVLSDQPQAVAEQYSVYTPPSDDKPENLLHGTFVIDRSGVVTFVNMGYQPFLDNKSLLFWLSIPPLSSESRSQPTGVTSKLELAP